MKHRAYGLSSIERTPQAGAMVEAAAIQLALELDVPVRAGEARQAVDRADGFESLASDQADRQRHQIQLTGQVLVDRDGVVRWCHAETAGSYARFPSTDELLSLAEGLG